MPNLVTLGSLHLNGDRGPLLAGRRKVLALLAYLARHSPTPVPRAELIALFWPGSDDVRGKQSLRQAVAELRQALGDAIVAAPDSVAVRDQSLVVDATEFEASGRLERWSEVAHRWTGEFLPGVESLGGSGWTRWVQEQRESLRPYAVRAFELLAAECERTGQHREALQWSVRWCEAAPVEERAWSSRIRALVNSGRPVDAASCYASFAQALRVAEQRAPSAEFDQVKSLFAANRAASTGAAESPTAARSAPTITLSLLSQLTVDARSLIEAAAVLGEPASARTLQTVAELTPIAFRHAANDLAGRGLLQTSEADPGLYDFSSPENRRRVYDVIAGDRRRALHRSAFALQTVAASPQAADQHRQLGEERRRITLNRRHLVTGASVLAGAVVLAAGIAGLARNDALALTAGSTVLLADVQNATGDSTFDGALSVAATIALTQSSHVTLHQRPARAAGGLDEQQARAAATTSDVARVISLGIEGTDSGYRVSVRLVDPPSGDVLHEGTAEARRAEVIDRLDGLLTDVRRRLGEAEAPADESSRPLRVVASGSLEALDAYARGLRAKESGAASAARESWHRALALDSTFALAEVALADEAFERAATDEGDAWIQRAATHDGRLLPIEAMRVRQVRAQRSGNVREALRLATEVAQRAPSSDAWYTVAAVHLADHRCDDASPPLAKALGLDSANVRALVALARCAAEAGDVKAALGRYVQAQAREPALASQSAFAGEWGSILARAGRLAEAQRAFERPLASGDTRDSLLGLRSLAALAMYRGRFGEATQVLQRATRTARRTGSPALLRTALIDEAEAFLAIGGRTRASELVDEVVGLTVADGASSAAYLQTVLLMTRMGRINGAREMLRQFTARVTPEGPDVQWTERLLTAAIQLAERNAAGALAVLDDGTAPRELEPFRLAAVADASALAGQHEAAMAAARALAEAWHLGTIAQDEWMRATLRLARIAEAQGDTVTALAAYRRYVDRWKEADGYVVELAGAQRSLTRLGGNAVAVSR